MTRTTTLHAGRYYHAALIPGPHGGLCITSRRGGGVLIRDPGSWIDALREETDSDVREDLCRAALHA
jgi:hypothetical protein